MRAQTPPCQLFRFSVSGCFSSFSCPAAQSGQVPGCCTPFLGTRLSCPLDALPESLKAGLSCEETCPASLLWQLHRHSLSSLSKLESPALSAWLPTWQEPTSWEALRHTGNASDFTLCGLGAAGGANLLLQVHPVPRQAEAGLPAAVQRNGFTSIPSDCELFQFSDNLLCMEERISYADPLPPLPGEEAVSHALTLQQ